MQDEREAERCARGRSFDDRFRSSLRSVHLLPFAAGAAFALVFWLPLWFGGGFTGGDVYYHTFPEKSFVVDWWRQGVFPLWNNRFGNGFPLVAEGMTAPFYPPSALFYGLLDANAAHNANHLLHYVLCFAFSWMYARKIGLSHGAAALAGLVYAYGWFPARKSWDIAIIAGAYLPLFLWLVESYLATRRPRWMAWLGLAIGVQILAGQYNLAFITHVVVGLYALLRVALSPGASPGGAEPPGRLPRWSRWSPPALVALAGLLGYGTAAVMVVPTYELKQRSPRAAGGRFDPLEGAIPLPYLAQAVLPWKWYALDDDEFERRFHSRSSRLESHLYFGLVPLALLGWGLVSARRRGLPADMWATWCVIGGAALMYALGWLPFVARHAPGFNFFRGPSRYGLATTFAVAILAAAVLDSLTARRRRSVRRAIVFAVLLATTADLWWVGGQVGESHLTWRPAIDRLSDSELGGVLARENERAPVRLLTSFTTVPATNVPSLYGVSTVPPSLALPPLAYVESQPFHYLARSPRPYATATPEEVEWLRRTGVTHVLGPQRLDENSWRVEPVWSGRDDLLEREWQGGFSGPIHLYRLTDAPGRVRFLEPARGSARVIADLPQRVRIEADAPNGGRLVLTDLAWPGWHVTIDGDPAEVLIVEGRFRAVDLPPGRRIVEWTFQPASLYWGAAISGAAVLALGALAWIERPAGVARRT